MVSWLSDYMEGWESEQLCCSVKRESRRRTDVCRVLLTACSWQIWVSLSSCSSRTALAFSYCCSSSSISTFTCSTYAGAKGKVREQVRGLVSVHIWHEALALLMSDITRIQKGSSNFRWTIYTVGEDFLGNDETTIWLNWLNAYFVIVNSIWDL